MPSSFDDGLDVRVSDRDRVRPVIVIGGVDGEDEGGDGIDVDG